MDILNFKTGPGRAWCILGTNLSGIDDVFSRVSAAHPNGSVSFKGQQEIYESELEKDDTDFMDRVDPGTPAREFLGQVPGHAGLIDALGMTACLDKGFRTLSTGQSRKLMLLAPITRDAGHLVIQAPFDGLDMKSCGELSNALHTLHKQGIGLILFVYNRSDIPDWTTHLGLVSDGRLQIQGPRAQVLPEIERALKASGPDFQAHAGAFSPGGSPRGKRELVRLRNGAAGYGGQMVFQGLDLTIRTSDHTLITGPNGCGKSTLVQVIIGDHPACYQNDLRVFGIQRGSGESIWELKQHMGIVSADLHRNYRAGGSALACILSGLFDSIGLYQRVSPDQEEQGRAWLSRLGMDREAATPFRDLGFGAQRLVLIARAMIKGPRLLVLDEPTQGLDELNRNAVLDFLEGLARERLSTLLYVSHRQDEFRPFFTRQIRMNSGK